MAKSGEVVENPISGERVSFQLVSAETDGALLRWEHALRPGARVPYDHIHSVQEERFEVVAGEATVRIGNETKVFQAGDTFVIPAGIAHGLANHGEDELRVLTELRPAMNTELYFETVFGLARDGKVGKRGVPNMLHMAVIVRTLGENGGLPGTPMFLQKIGLTVLAAVGRFAGYKGRYKRYSGPAGR
ncbi:MAG TPA: cupin domain-containing protein [Dehalococcoidia bacterium]|nr:cupin domain-containing protein [Dehalococcoidia bacterium]